MSIYKRYILVLFFIMSFSLLVGSLATTLLTEEGGMIFSLFAYLLLSLTLLWLPLRVENRFFEAYKRWMEKGGKWGEGKTNED
ncbi:hypothetical protein [Priestia endophytica]|jgi:hypothetical protein|uniref:hypothetical protein n=1 Tax=Priestia endophytica TaxID=135735 RepID=UPI00124DCD65|nr:hypothetical protein [Priestia endophytica]KAB2493320.1 hypothetical protein F8155_13535 [Priestia endophytica]